MSCHKKISSGGFTIAELMMAVVLISIVLVMFNNFFAQSFQGYLNLQTSTVRTNEVSGALQRMVRVLRGINTITDAQPNQIVGFAYFTPRDTTLSKVRYFYDNSNHSLKVGVIPATGSAPNYIYNSADEIISTIATNINNTESIFRYINNENQEAVFTESNYKDIKGVRVVLKTFPLGNNQDTVNLQTTVTLRNRKTNL